MAVAYEDIAKAFVQEYYKRFDQSRGSLGPLYHERALFSFEGAQIQGRLGIQEKLNSLAFQQVVHLITTLDAQPMEDGSIIVQVMGQLKADSDSAFGFNQTFVLKPAMGNYFVMHDIFRLALHHG